MSKRRATTGIGLALLLALPAGGCESFLAVNDNPNEPESVRMEQTLPGLIVAFTNDVLAGAPAEWSGQWLQQWSYNRDEMPYSQIELYELTSIDTDEFWSDAYTNVMVEARNIMDEAAASEAWAYHGIAKFLLAWTATIVSDAFGPIPFSEALDPLNPDPAYDTQQEVYQAAHQMIEEAIEEMQRPGDRVPSANDLLLAGDMARWVQLARTVQARLHMRLTNAPGESAEERAQQALNALAEGITETVAFDYVGGPGARQPLWNSVEWDDPQTASSTFIALLERLDDPRLPIMVAPAAYDGAYRGHVPGALRNITGDPFFDEQDRCTVAPESCDPADENYPTIAWNDSIVSHLGDALLADSVDYVWMSLAEAKFLEAEAQLIVNGAAAADAPYRDGIRAHMEWLGVPAAEIQTYLDALPSLTAVPNAEEAIITQKYIANFMRIEAWNDWRRTGYPVLTLVEDPYVPGIPQRLRTPAAEINNNGENVAATGIPTGLDGLLHEVWWASGN
ncbi:MAG TPA: SusD/RagB family nutrient-binding outer membrane lipoprotein [Longimicrobiales bacterium]